MNKKQVFVLLSVSLLALGFSIFQYVKEFQAEYADAYSSTKPANGHLWSEMECTSSLCITGGNIGIGTDSPASKLSVTGNANITGNLGVGTASPSQKLEVSGNILASGDVCNGAGACLSQIASFVGSQPLVNSNHTYANCTSAGGIITSSDVTYPLCKFIAASCPTGWTIYKSYSVTTAATCGDGTHGCTTCTTGSHSTWGNNSIETCIWTTYTGSSCSDLLTCSATPTQIGCY